MSETNQAPAGAKENRRSLCKRFLPPLPGLVPFYPFNPRFHRGLLSFVAPRLSGRHHAIVLRPPNILSSKNHPGGVPAHPARDPFICRRRREESHYKSLRLVTSSPTSFAPAPKRQRTGALHDAPRSLAGRTRSPTQAIGRLPERTRWQNPRTGCLMSDPVHPVWQPVVSGNERVSKLLNPV